MNCSWSRILIPFSRSVALSRIACPFFAIAFVSHYYISITFRCASAIIYTFVTCYTFNYTYVDSCSSFTKTFSSLASFYIVYASMKCCSSALSSFDPSMHTGSIDVVHGPIYSLTHQHDLLLCKNSTTNVPVVSMS
jgi:hypothetical protein